MEDASNPHDDIDDHHVSSKLVVCGHTFGEGCIVHWLESSTTCPLCRTLVYFDPNTESEPEEPGDTPAARDPSWVLHDRPHAIRTMENLLNDDTVPVAIVLRALDLILRNTSEHTRPIHPWWWLTWMLADNVRQLAVDGWAAWIQWLENAVIKVWEEIPGDPRWYDYEDIRLFRELAQEAQPMTQTIRSEVEISREVMGWEALPHCQFWWL